VKLPRIAQDAVKSLEAGLRAAAIAPRQASATAAEAETDAEFSEERALFISVKPHYASAILDGQKTVELRRTRPNLSAGTLVILYSSTPTRAVVGWAQLAAVREGTPGEIWAEFGFAAGIDEPSYDIYFDGADQAFALELDDVVAASQPVPLDVIRSIGIQPPQSWRYVPADVSSRIQASAAR
jgi:predicted transcriptional regulator